MLVANRASTEVIDVFIDLNKGTVYLSSELFPFFCMYIVLPFSPFLLFFYSSILNSPRFHAHCYLPSFCLSHASPGSHFFSFTPLFWFLCAMCTTFSSIFNFPHTRSVDHNCLEPRIKAPFQNILSRPWSVKISLTDGPSCWIHLVKPWICGLSSIVCIVGKMGRRSNGLSE